MADVCPVCGSTEWGIDYDHIADGEMRVDRCAECEWPPPGPHTVEEWRAKWQEWRITENLMWALDLTEENMAEHNTGQNQKRSPKRYD